MKSHPRSLPAMAARVPVVRPRDERYELPPIPRDYRMTIAAVCIGFCLAGLVLGAVLALVWP